MAAARYHDLPPSLLLVERIAERAGTDPLELPPLNDTIDPDSIDALVADAEDDANRRIEFTYAGFRVTVTGAGDVELSPAE